MDTDDPLDNPLLAHKVGQEGGHQGACDPFLRDNHVVLEEALFPFVEEHQVDSLVHACYYCDHHFVRCRDEGASQHSPDHLQQETCGESVVDEVG